MKHQPQSMTMSAVLESMVTVVGVPLVDLSGAGAP